MKGKRKKEEPSIAELVRSIRRERERWKEVKRKGTSDPFWPDGVNLSLIRSHILSYRDELRKRCKAERVRPCPREARVKLPPTVPSTYMAPGSKAARYSVMPIKRRRKRRKR